MAKALPDLRMTVAGFARWPGDGTDTRYELAGGRLVVMTPPSGRHAVITRNVFRALDRRLRLPCEPMFGAGVARDLDDEECRIPDVFVTCEPTPEHIFTAPRVVVEVLSPSTEKEDRTTKLDLHKSLPTVEAILLVWQERRRVELHAREGRRWPAQDLVAGSAAPLPGLDVELPLDEIYAGVELSPPAPSRPSA